MHNPARIYRSWAVRMNTENATAGGGLRFVVSLHVDGLERG